MHSNARALRHDTSSHGIPGIVQQTGRPTRPDRNPVVHTHRIHGAPNDIRDARAAKLDVERVKRSRLREPSGAFFGIVRGRGAGRGGRGFECFGELERAGGSGADG